MATYLTPGVYYERVDTAAPAVSGIRTDVAGFIGIAPRGPVDLAVPVESWRQYQAHFGGFTGVGFLAYAVRGYFENGGRRCWVVRVASRDPLAGVAEAAAELPGRSGDPVWRVVASSPGAWGNSLSVTCKRTSRAQTVTDPARSTPTASAVASTSGFKRGTMVRLSQGATTETFKVVSEVEPVAGLLIWVHKDPAMRLPYDAPVGGFRPDQPVLVESVEYTVVVRESNRPVALYENLSLVPEHDDYGPRALAPLYADERPEQTGRLPPPPRPVRLEELRDDAALLLVEPLAAASDEVFRLAGGRDGLALLSTYEYVGEEISPLDGDEVRRRKRRGLRALELVDEVAAVAAPDIHIRPFLPPERAPLPACVPDPCLPPPPPAPAEPPAPEAGELPPVFSEDEVFLVQAAMVRHCEDRRDRLALLDPPAPAALDPALGVAAVRAWRSRFDSKYAAFYHPWLRVVDPLRAPGRLTRDIPPTGHVAGQFARTDFADGVHKAPANAPLGWAQDVTALVGDALHGVFNQLGVNVVRAMPGRGLRIFGARTTSSDPDWVFVNVRRLLMMIEKALFISSQWAVFEPNDLFTRAKLRLSISSFLISLWQRGALAGASAEEAFFVKCDDENNPPAEREQGRLLAQVGVAPSHPFEFVVLRIGRADNEFEIAEEGVARGGA